MSLIAPGTLCIVMGNVEPKYLGRCVTVIARPGYPCSTCGADIYQITPFPGFTETFACRAVLKPILPPGVNTGIEHTEDLKVPA